MLGILFILIGILSIIFNKEGAKLYAEFQKGWGLEGSAIRVGRFLGIFGGLLMISVGVMFLSQ